MVKKEKKEQTEGKGGAKLVNKPPKKGQQQKWTPYDIWESQEGGEPNDAKGKRVKYVPTLLRAVVPPHEGMSYNPPVDSYLGMANQIAREEQKIEKKQRRTERRVDICPSLAAALPGLRQEVLYTVSGRTVKRDDTKMSTDNEQGDDEEEAKISAKEMLPKKPKSAKEKKRRKLRKEEEKKQNTAKEMEGKMRKQLESLKSLKSEVLTEMEVQKKRSILKKRQKALKAVTQRKRLGRGKFEPFEELLLSVDELPLNLRQLSPQGNVLEERIKSFQRRNLLPIAGERPNNLKARLKFKMVEKRSVKEVDEDSRVI